MTTAMGGVTGTITSPAALRCRICGTEYPVEARSICEECFGPLEPAYDLGASESELRATYRRYFEDLWDRQIASSTTPE